MAQDGARRAESLARARLGRVSRLRDRVVRSEDARGELTLYQLDRATEITCARCAGRSVTRWVAVLRGDWTSLWCKSCFQAMPG
jgi:hypothetical protein